MNPGCAHRPAATGSGDAGRACCRDRTPRSRPARIRGLDLPASWYSSWRLEPDNRAAALDPGKAGRGQAFAEAVGLIVELEANVAGAQDGAAAPHQRLPGAHHDAAVLVDRLTKTVKPLWLPRDLGLEAFAGFDPIPAAGEDGAAVLDPGPRHDGIARVVPPGELGDSGLLARPHH